MFFLSTYLLFTSIFWFLSPDLRKLNARLSFKTSTVKYISFSLLCITDSFGISAFANDICLNAFETKLIRPSFQRISFEEIDWHLSLIWPFLISDRKRQCDVSQNSDFGQPKKKKYLDRNFWCRRQRIWKVQKSDQNIVCLSWKLEILFCFYYL